MSTIRVGIDANINPDGSPGGVQQFIIGLVSGLSKRQPEDVEIVLITHPAASDWLSPYANDRMELVTRSPSFLASASAALGLLRKYVKPLARPILQWLRSTGEVAVADDAGYFSSLNLDVVHFPSQNYIESDVPSVYNPHDLQHLHYPEFFTDKKIERRETIYRAGCDGAGQIGVASKWIKDDIVKHYGTDPEKVTVIPTAPPSEAYEAVSDADLEDVDHSLGLPESFAFYPAKSWPHKNHQNLVEAVNRLRVTEGIDVPIVLTGKRTDHWKSVQSLIDEKGVSDLVHHYGFVSEREMRCLYKLSTFTVIPTLFEAASLPMFEAWREGSPVAAANVTSLPAIAGDAALLFNPRSVEEIADTIQTLMTDEATRESLAKAGQERVSRFTWERTAQRYLDVYRAIAEDRVDEISDSEVPIRMQGESLV